MKRIVVLIDGTWNKEADAGDTNVARLDCNKQIAKFIKSSAADGTIQQVFYHPGVGSEGEPAVLRHQIIIVPESNFDRN